ncbi:CDP-alcohol phosphatidyltransferase family protein [Salinisphaera aquimarina]
MTAPRKDGRSCPGAATAPRVARGSGVDILAGFGLTLLLVEILLATIAAPAALRLSAGGLYIALALLLCGVGETLPRSLGWGNRVTLTRAALVITIAGMVAFPAFLGAHLYAFIGLAVAALALDGVDGWIARRTASVSAFGARFDMELDAFFILVLCAALAAVGKVGLFVLWIGLARYLFVLAQRVAPWLRAELFASLRRKAVCVWQVVTLVICLLPAVSPPVAALASACALVLLALSFGIDVAWLYRRRGSHAADQHA